MRSSGTNHQAQAGSGCNSTPIHLGLILVPFTILCSQSSSHCCCIGLPPPLPQMDNSSLRERLEAATSEATSSHKDCEALRHALSTVEAKLSVYQQKDAEVRSCGRCKGARASCACPGQADCTVYTRIREALEAAEGARLARDASAAQRKELEAELAAMQQRMAGVRQVWMVDWEGAGNVKLNT
eukprot:368857-Pelagomonas_calceolata.AAC.8